MSDTVIADRADPLIAYGSDRPYVSASCYARNNPVRFVDPSGLESQPAAVKNPAGCVIGLFGGLLLMEASTVVAIAGLGPQGISIAAFGIAFGVSAPVTAAGVVGGAMLEGIGLAGDVAGGVLIYQSCLATQCGSAASCVVIYDLGKLAERTWAFDGTVVASNGNGNGNEIEFEFEVHQWFRGGMLNPSTGRSRVERDRASSPREPRSSWVRDTWSRERLTTSGDVAFLSRSIL